ncbi:MobF family relaxase [Kineosporia sp. A_224]|uniref:MobF family relaxase n=1 Tax=Kineosporia sp. A_224 TaxID=1962180 RepID=UPI00130429EA|nr:MobF family relaxase [Kineosporia sp. A_224]
MLSIATGHSTTYLTDQVGSGMESYYTGAVGAGEPPGRWWGKGAAALGLEGEVDADVMAGVYGAFRNPLDERFADPDTRDQAGVLGRRPKQFRTPEQVVEDRIRDYTTEYTSTPSPEQVQAWRVEAERDGQSAVHFYDLTFSPDKSVTVLHTAFVRAGYDARAAGDDETAARWEWAAAQVEDAVMTASAVGLDYVERRAAYTRTGRHGRGGTGQWQDVHALTVARFFQHTSRDHDPQLHVHQAVFIKVQGDDGQWRALDGKPLHSARAAVAAVSERELEGELTRRLGVSWEMREDGIGRRIVGVERDVEDLFSSRRRAITAEAERRLTAFEDKYGRPATGAERAVIERRSAMATRRAKTHESENVEEQNERWHALASTAIAGGLSAVAATFAPVVEAAADGRLAELEAADDRFSAETVIVEALEACHGPDGKATFTRHDLIRQLHLALPTNLGRLESGEAGALLEKLADRALAHEDVIQVSGREVGTAPASARLSDGTAATVNPAKVQYATRGHLSAEMAVLRAAGVRGRTALEAAQVEAWLDAHPVGATLNPAQRSALVGLASSDAATAVLVGPAGTGKSYTAAAFDLAWRDLAAARADTNGAQPGRAVGVAITQAAADVLADDGVADTVNIAAFLAAQGRLAGGRGTDEDDRWRLSSSDVLLVDEASMADTRSLNRLQAAADAAGARLVMMGDPHQLGPVGAGGMMRAAIDRDAETYSLSDVRRFGAEWERTASLRLRDGHADAVADYDRRGRVRDGGREQEAIAAIAHAAAADRLAGKDVVVVTATNEHAAQVSSQVRRVLADAGLVGEASVVLERDGTGAGVGDLVQGRRIDRDLGLVNREVYRIDSVDDDGAVHVTSTRTGAEHVMPPSYVAADVSLAYASTAHGAQGRTVDVGHVLLTPHLDRAGAYVGLTRGRESNTAWAVTDTGIPEVPATTGRAMLAQALNVETSHRAPAADDVPADAAAVDVAAADEAHRRNAGTLLGLIEDQTHLACRTRLEADLDTLIADGILSEAQRARFGAEQGAEHLARLLRTHELAGRDPQHVLRNAVTAGSLENALALSQVIASRIDKTWSREAERDGTSTGTGLPMPSGHDLPARTAEDAAGYVEELHGLLDARRRNLGEQLAAQAAAGEELPGWLGSSLGPLPTATPIDAYEGVAEVPGARCSRRDGCPGGACASVAGLPFAAQVVAVGAARRRPWPLEGSTGRGSEVAAGATAGGELGGA